MRLVSIFLLGALLLPVAIADGARHDETVTIPTEDHGTFYLTACRGFGISSTAVEVDLIDDCLTSGVYQEQNGRDGLQVRAGVDTDNSAYEADPGVLTL